MSKSCRHWLIAVFATLAVVTFSPAYAEPGQPVPQLGILWTADPSTAAPYIGAFKEGLRDLGWIDGRNIAIVERYDHGDATRRPRLASQLVALGVDVLYANDPSVPAARMASKRIPIVCPDFYDAVAQGITTSLAKPDGNVTGISWQSVESAVKRLQLVLELLPRARRVAFVYEPGDPGSMIELRAILDTGQKVGVAIETLGLRSTSDVEAVLAAAKSARVDALLVGTTPATWPSIGRIVEGAKAIRVPVISETDYYAQAGAVVAFGTDIIELYRRSAVHVDKVLRGVAPADLPIEQPTHFELVVNLKSAKTLGLVIPDSIMVRATRVIR